MSTILEAALSVRGLSSGYAGAVVVREVNLSIAPGEILAVLGKNGMGKSTLLKAVMGFLPKMSGSVSLGGSEVTRLSPHRVARLGVGYVAQEKALFQDMTVEENLRLAVRRPDFEAALAEVEASFPFLLERLKQRAGTLSGGEQKMLLMARSLATGAKLLLVDEITEGLQPSVIDRLAGVIRSARERHGTTVLLVEQHLPFALAVADCWAVLDRGEVAETGVASEPDASRRVLKHMSV
ncbi:ABC transporter ATPase component; putative branched-chain amino acid transporter component [Methylorubrum extorquens DM4]|uniref:ABC transporter ATPase component putative branched-chain amino acid transporter component n=1 Tax=Methylorubrum extorquens (strain DSM 6343 / CIP 106787 / DM4) TaxID=661410 RepID=C7CET0_METED|nr:ABC transporter ATP-binding protein [Methylorubrum extorquens]CAX26032.1 ABC transporter ATPase component; putative branched-chain amino acid transporter component [Methylorubrum extorquens DM4]